MKQIKNLLFIVICLAITLSACNRGVSSSNTRGLEESTMNGNSIVSGELPTFANIPTSPEATEPRAISEITKIIFFEAGYPQRYNEIAIDIANRRLYTYPDTFAFSFIEPDYIMNEDDVHQALELLEKYEVLSWEREIIGESPAGADGNYSWIMYIQYSDGTISIHSGQGVYMSQVQPENFNEFVGDMINFTHSRVPNV